MSKQSVHFILVTREDEDMPESLAKYSKKLDIPNVNLTRVGKIKIAIAKGIVSGLFKKGDKIICLSAVCRSSVMRTASFLSMSVRNLKF
ncbi:MAG: hypothetical protein MZV70_23890 [Desulfobacterales bacterium]|nr:hypothetical protein [Desulfobacterales bacterium]